MKRVAVVDIGSNSTRLFIADVDGNGAMQIERLTNVTRLADGVDTSHRLSDEAISRVDSVLADYRKLIDEHHVETTIGLLTSAVRDASNGDAFLARVRDVYGIDARILPGHEEGRLTFLGATADRADAERVAVVDIGGGSTEIITGGGFSISLQMGVVRFTERHLHHDPPEPDELQGFTTSVREVLEVVLPPHLGVQTLVAVAGTATSAAAIVHGVEPYDSNRIHGARVTAGDLEELLARLAILTNAERREVRGLHPDRAPTIVAGIVILLETVRAFGLDEFEVSEHDILVGAALDSELGRAGTG